jgi:hypothetical protein
MQLVQRPAFAHGEAERAFSQRICCQRLIDFLKQLLESTAGGRGNGHGACRLMLRISQNPPGQRR